MELVQNNSLLGMSVIVAKAQNCKSFMDQLREGFGELDDQRWNQLYVPVLPNGFDIPPVEVREVNKSNPVPMSPEDLHNYVQMTQSTTFLVTEPWLFRISLLILLTLPRKTETNILHSKLLTILKRRLQWIYSSSPDLVRTNLEEEMARVMIGIQNLQKLSKIAVKVID